MEYNDILNSVKKSVKEETASSAVAFIPGGFKTVSDLFKKLSKQKSKWGVDVLDSEDSYDLNIENKYKITVPKKHVKEFADEIGIDLSNKISSINVNGFLNESIFEDMNSLFSELTVELENKFKRFPVLNIQQDVIAFNRFFPGINKDIKDNLLDLYNYKKQVKEVVDELKVIYADDRGMIELLISDLKRDSNLDKYEVFKNYKNFTGVNIVSLYNGVKFIFECCVTMDMQISERIFVSDPSALSLLEDDPVSKFIRINKNVIYPLNPRFPRNFFKSLHVIVKDGGDSSKIAVNKNG